MDDDDLVQRYQVLLDIFWASIQVEMASRLKNILAVEAGFDCLDPKEIDRLIDQLLS